MLDGNAAILTSGLRGVVFAPHVIAHLRARAAAFRAAVVGTFLVAVVAACSAPAGTTTPQSGTSLPTPSASPSGTPAAEQISGTFAIGDGRELYLQCVGSGSPTILLEAGDTDTGTNAWRPVVPGLIHESRTCTYDRAGLGQSSPATGCRQLDDLLDDLDALLGTAGVEGPYVLVGASGGGFIMAGFAARHPEEVAGMVFVEVPKALTAELYPEVVPLIACDAPDNIERRDYLAVEHAAWDNRTEVGDFPLTVLSNDYGDTVEPDTDEATNVEDQRVWFDLSAREGRQVVVTSGHGIPYAEPQLVIDEILAVLRTARGG
jgi:pimeloyl-ACP methyl ester carboxylesterase